MPLQEVELADKTVRAADNNEKLHSALQAKAKQAERMMVVNQGLAFENTSLRNDVDLSKASEVMSTLAPPSILVIWLDNNLDLHRTDHEMASQYPVKSGLVTWRRLRCRGIGDYVVVVSVTSLCMRADDARGHSGISGYNLHL